MTSRSALEPEDLVIAPASARGALRRALDLVGALALLVLTAPVLVVTIIVAFLLEGRPVFFTQSRVGRYGRDFTVVKFRTMRVNRIPVEEVGVVGPDHQLVTPIGRILRRFKIDELPQVVNVIRGDMSLVGPRPTIREQVDRYTPFQRRRLEVKPGITGWSQVNGNTVLTWADRIQMDVWYVDHWSVALDIRIMLRTLGVVLRGERPIEAAVEVGRNHTGKRA